MQLDQSVSKKQLNCNTRGLNKRACLGFARGFCKFESKKGCVVLESLTGLTDCKDLGKDACLAVPSISCYWDLNAFECLKFTNEKYLIMNQILVNLKACTGIVDGYNRPKV